MKPTVTFAIAVACILPCASAFAQFAKPEDAIKYRRSALTVMATHFGRVAGMANGRIPFDANAAVANATIAEQMSKLPYVAFVDGSDKGDTNAKPLVWSDRAKFNAAAEKLQGEMTKLVAAARAGNQDALRAQAGATGAACKACHDDFRKD